MLHHPFVATQISAVGRGDDEAMIWFRSEIESSWLVTYVNSAPTVRFAKLPFNLLGGMSLYRWSFSDYRQVLHALRRGGAITVSESNWLLKGPLADPVIRQRISKDPAVGGLAVESLVASPKDRLAFRIRRFRRHTKSGRGLVVAAASVRRTVGKGWTVKAVRHRGGTIDFDLSHRLSTGMTIETHQSDQAAALRHAVLEATRSREWRAIASAPARSHQQLLGHLRAAAAAWGWRPSFLYQVLERLSVAGVISGHEVLWVMRVGPPGNYKWKQTLDGAVIDDLAAWKEKVYPAWRAWERRERRAAGRRVEKKGK
ncbi:MAG TPA: hypothetical protein VKQ30_03285 [Ktedonobacterales bacterium]|nr:hypothetical protein [Ktedonobacterales bacterium]